ncbi:hypothetical protein MNEG_10878, partial [Monoraphidium neglectum]
MIDAGPDIVVGTDPATGKATTDITLTLGGYTASDITTNNVNCTLKTGTTWTCRNLVAGDTVVTFAGNKAGCEQADTVEIAVVDCAGYVLDAGPDLTVEPDAVTGTGSTDVTLTLGSYPASDVTVDNANCTFKTGTTWTCRNLVAGDTVVTFSVTYA